MLDNSCADTISGCPSFIAGRSCLTSLSDAVVVFVPLGVTAESYIAESIGTPRTAPVVGSIVSVNFIIDEFGNITELVAVQNTPLTIAEFHNPALPPNPLLTQANLNCPLITVGLAGFRTFNDGCTPLSPGFTPQKVVGMRRLLCCLRERYDITISHSTVLLASEFDDRIFTLTSFPEGLLEDFDAYCTSLFAVSPSNPPVPSGITPCCADLAIDIQEIRTIIEGLTPELIDDLAGLPARVTALEATVLGLQTTVNGFAGQIAAISSSYNAIVSQFQSIQSCLDCVCPPLTTTLNIDYETLAGTIQNVLRGNDTWVDLPVQLSDTNPASVTIGSLWRANLDGSCNRQLLFEFRFNPAEFCAGCTLYADLDICGTRHRLATHTSTGGLDTVTLTGMFAITTGLPCQNVHIWLGTTDNQSAVKVLNYGRVTMLCTV